MEAAKMVLDPKDDLPAEQAVPARELAKSELLDLALNAHGGLDRWNKVKAIKVAASITGAIWFVKGKGDSLKNVVLTAETRNERLTVDFTGQNKRAIFEPNRILIETLMVRSSRPAIIQRSHSKDNREKLRGTMLMSLTLLVRRCGRT